MHSYSLVIETENLSMADSACLWRCLQSVNVAISKVAPPVEAILINSGGVSDQMAAILKRDFPWITLAQVPAGENYYESKMHGIRLATSDIVVLIDSDCCYNENWLAGLLSPFEDREVNVVAGETSFVGNSPYSLAMAIIHSFNGFSGRDKLYPVSNYYANNVAFRRHLVMQNPIPTALPLYRHGCSWHCVKLREAGETIWAQPASRADHALPEGFSHFFWRFLLFGRDRAVRARLGLRDNMPKANPIEADVRHIILQRFQRVIHNQPHQKKWIPAAAVIVVFSYILIRIGAIVSAVRPELAISHFGAIEGVHYPTVEEFKDSNPVG